ncbi:MAG TPA: phenylacetate--CoA ligase family protein [Ramlibacter sp.]|nr:phenylacetate--CoA ligase family protein [Ramlibacter sp.]
MSSCFDPWLTGVEALDAIVAAQGTHAGLAARRQRRLAALLDAAVRGSPFYRERLRGARPESLEGIEPVRKRELMRNFDTWVTDARLQLRDLRAFVADASTVGQAWGDAFVVWESSGSSGEPGIFVQDARAMAVYDALEACRRMPRWFDPWYVGERIAFVGATRGHFASTVTAQRLRRLNPAMAANLSEVSFLQPTPALVRQLNELAPTIVSTYPTAAVLLAEEAAAGRLRISPAEVWTGGETLTAGMRRRIERQFGSKVINSYGASEFLALAWQCRCGALHLNSDWAILEPVDEHLHPVPPGVASYTALLTNLANHVQPIIRYDLGDRVLMHRHPCACGSPLPVIDVQGRCDEMLVLCGRNGAPVRLLPLALTTVLEDEGGVFDFQLVQVAPNALRLSVGGDEAVLARARTALLAFLREHGLAQVRVSAICGRERVHGRTGKLQRVLAQSRDASVVAAGPRARQPTPNIS